MKMPELDNQQILHIITLDLVDSATRLLEINCYEAAACRVAILTRLLKNKSLP